MSRPANRHAVSVFTSAAVLVLLWVLTIGDPCLIAFASGGDYLGANPIAITECSVTADGFLFVTIGDVITRLAVLALLMGVFGYGFALLIRALEKRTLAGLAVAATIATLIVADIAQVILAPWANRGMFYTLFCIGAAIVTWFGVKAGVSVARPVVAS